MLDDADPQYAKLKDFQYSASIYDIVGANPRITRPAGQWNTLEINCDGHHVTTRHNGVIVTDVTAESHPALKLRELKGFLGLQNHSTEVKFRISVLELRWRIQRNDRCGLVELLHLPSNANANAWVRILSAQAFAW